MKVIFLVRGPAASSYRFRVLQYLPFLEDHGVKPTLYVYKRRFADNLRRYQTLGQYDLVFIQRKLFFPLEFWYLRRKAHRIVYDFDDAIMYRSSSAKRPFSLSRRLKFAYLMRHVDFVIAGNQFLQSEVERYQSHVQVIPTPIDLAQYSLKQTWRAGDPLTIGWLGSRSTLKYLNILMPSLETLYRQHPNFCLKIVCDQFLEGFNVPIVKKRWSFEEEGADLKSFDIGVMPLSDDPWSRGKCGLKILQYFGVGLPVVCTPVGINQEMVQDGVNGFWARNGIEWEDRLLRLMGDPETRREMGLKGRECVEKAYCLDVTAPRVLEVFERVMSSRQRRGS